MVKWPRLEKYDPIEIHWDDINANPAWHSLDAVEVKPPTKCTSLGYYINRDGGFLRASYSKNDDEGYSCEVIPIGCITKVVILSRRR